ncbi:hypothetical protein QBC39DRAFT_88149 [Podospora conica]|nr:hypothetical protein QBC39DRAFT_88149 [Schizothecium conicum]
MMEPMRSADYVMHPIRRKCQCGSFSLSAVLPQSPTVSRPPFPPYALVCEHEIPRLIEALKSELEVGERSPATAIANGAEQTRPIFADTSKYHQPHVCTPTTAATPSMTASSASIPRGMSSSTEVRQCRPPRPIVWDAGRSCIGSRNTPNLFSCLSRARAGWARDVNTPHLGAPHRGRVWVLHRRRAMVQMTMTSRIGTLFPRKPHGPHRESLSW